MRVDWVRRERVQWLSGLPSSDSANALLDGKPDAIPVMAFHTAVRAAFVGLGLYVAGFRGDKLLKGSIAGALGIEAGVIAWTLGERRNKS